LEKTTELVTLLKLLSKGHLKQLVLVQPSLTVTQKVIFLQLPVARVVSNIVRIVCFYIAQPTVS